MSSSRHPIALSLERRVSDSTRLLAVVMCLPLVDGVFAALVLAGALESVAGILEVGILIFGGSAMVAVVLAEMDEGPREQARLVLAVGVIVILGAAVTAALAPTIESLLTMAVFERFAAVVILAVAATTASARIGEYLPGPAVIVGLGLFASIAPGGASLTLQLDPALIGRSVAAASVGVGFALTIAITSPWLRNAVDIDRFRFGSAVALGVLAVSIAGFIPGNAPVALAVLLVTAVLAFDPQRAREREWTYRPDDIDVTAAFSDGGLEARDGDEREQTGESVSGDSTTADSPDPPPAEDGPDRPPWL